MSNAKDNSIFDNIKLLGANIQSDIPAFVKNIREAKSSFEEILKKLKIAEILFVRKSYTMDEFSRIRDYNLTIFINLKVKRVPHYGIIRIV